jgi:hypothetical protein
MNQDDVDKSAREQEWPASLDALVAAPDHHELQNDPRVDGAPLIEDTSLTDAAT